jgi:transcription initiation factor TFIID subunit 7
MSRDILLTRSELAAALAGNADGNGTDGQSEDGLSAEEDDDDEEANKDEEDDEETTEKKAKIRQFTSEIKALESAIEKKKASFTRGNAIMEVS